MPLIQFASKMLNDPSANPLLLVDALQNRSHYRDACEHARNWAEPLASGVNISTMDPEIYIRSQMEADVSWTLGLDKPDDLPEPVAATRKLYDLFAEKEMFGELQVRAAANVTLQAPKNSVGGLATRHPVEIGEFVASPSPNPYYLFLSEVTKRSPRAYAIALAFDPNVLLTMQPTAAFSMRENWDKAFRKLSFCLNVLPLPRPMSSEFLTPLARHRDDMRGLHMSTHVPQRLCASCR